MLSADEYEDLRRISLEECLEYRLHTEKQRLAFINLLNEIAGRIKHDAWSPEIEQELKDEIKKAQDAIKEQKASLRKAYKELFHKTVIGVAVSTAPVLLSAVFPGITVASAFLLGAGTTTGLLAEPIKDLAKLWANGLKDQKNSLSYLLDLKKEGGKKNPQAKSLSFSAA